MPSRDLGEPDGCGVGAGYIIALIVRYLFSLIGKLKQVLPHTNSAGTKKSGPSDSLSQNNDKEETLAKTRTRPTVNTINKGLIVEIDKNNLDTTAIYLEITPECYKLTIETATPL